MPKVSLIYIFGNIVIFHSYIKCYCIIQLGCYRNKPKVLTVPKNKTMYLSSRHRKHRITVLELPGSERPTVLSSSSLFAEIECS